MNQLEKLCTGAIWSEGPVWLTQDESVLWSDIPNNRMLRWSKADGMTVWRDKVEFTNGHTLDNEGNLLHCSHGLRAIVKTPMINGKILAQTQDEVLVTHFGGKRLNSPNDVVVKSDGTIWFTDPPYGILSDREGHKAQSELGFNGVYCFDPRTKTLQCVSTAVEEPNGLAFSPDESKLFVSDTSAALRPEGEGNHHIVVMDVTMGTNGAYQLSAPEVFVVIENGLADGFRIHPKQQLLYTSSGDGVLMYNVAPADFGKWWGKIPVPEKVGNLCFGGKNGNEVFVCASTSLYRYQI